MHDTVVNQLLAKVRVCVRERERACVCREKLICVSQRHCECVRFCVSMCMW